jgi:hypothetical protein
MLNSLRGELTGGLQDEEEEQDEEIEYLSFRADAKVGGNLKGSEDEDRLGLEA